MLVTLQEMANASEIQEISVPSLFSSLGSNNSFHFNMISLIFLFLIFTNPFQISMKTSNTKSWDLYYRNYQCQDSIKKWREEKGIN